MTDFTANGPLPVTASPVRRDIGIKRRYAAERRFRLYGIFAIGFGLLFLALLIWSVVSKGYTAFQQTEISIPVEFSEKVIDPQNKRATDPNVLMMANYPVLARDALAKELGAITLGHCDVTEPATIDAVFAEVKKQWGKIDFVVHAIAFADRDQLAGR